MWKIESVSSGPEAKVVLSYISADGEAGYPGELKVIATYSLSDDNELALEYRATTNKPTMLNLTNHSFYNLAGGDASKDIMDQKVTLHAARFTPVDETLIPTGERRPVAGTPFDFRTPMRHRRRIRDGRDEQIRIGRGYDHNFVIDGAGGNPASGGAAGRPRVGKGDGNSGHCARGPILFRQFPRRTFTGKKGRVYRQGDGMALEPAVFPDSPNHPELSPAPGSIRARLTPTAWSSFLDKQIIEGNDRHPR